MNPKGHIFVATPTYTGDVAYDYASALALASMHCILRGVWIEPRGAAGFSLVEYARNWLVAEFLESKATHLFWVDADLWFAPDAIYRLFSRGKDAIAGVYTTKHETAPIFPYMADGPVKDGIQLAERVPGGFLCVSRAAVEKVVSTCEWHEIEHAGKKRLAPRFFDLRLDGTKLVGEDYIACERLRRAGFKIYVETDISFIHYGRRAWRGNLAETLREEAEKGFAGQGAVEDTSDSASKSDHN